MLLVQGSWTRGCKLSFLSASSSFLDLNFSLLLAGTSALRQMDLRWRYPTAFPIGRVPTSTRSSTSPGECFSLFVRVFVRPFLIWSLHLNADFQVLEWSRSHAWYTGSQVQRSVSSVPACAQTSSRLAYLDLLISFALVTPASSCKPSSPSPSSSFLFSSKRR